MNQEFIVYIVLVVTVGVIFFYLTKKKRVKKAPVGNHNCGSSGCSGCALKDHCS